MLQAPQTRCLMHPAVSLPPERTMSAHPRQTQLVAIVALVAASATVAAIASGQEATALDRFEPAPAGDRLLSLPSPEVLGHLRPGAGVLLSYAHEPLVLRDDSGEQVASVVDHQLILHNLLSLELWHRLEIEVDVPVLLSQGGDSPNYPSFSASSPSGAAMGDVRAGLQVELLRQQGHWPAAALAFRAWFPSGDAEGFSSAGVVRYAPQLIIGADHGPLVWSAHMGRRFQGETERPSALGSELFWGVGAGPRIGPVLLTAEVNASTVLEGDIDAFGRTTTNLEGLLSARYTLGPVVFGLAGGPGVNPGAGTPAFRLVGSVVYTPPAPSHAEREAQERAEREREREEARARGEEPAPATTPAPLPTAPSDRDGDGFLDDVDACPDRVGDDSNPDRRGCPPDRDRDGIADSDDRCPDVPGQASVDPALHGCPLDTDGDGIVDDVDACPREKGIASDKPEAHGCPEAVRVQGQQIVLLQTVEFKTGRAELEPSASKLLEQVAAVLREHPEIARVAVDGHTDNVGREQANVVLSQARAVTVVRWMAEHGIDARRLEARGFGPRRPIADNGTDEGRARNRRVEFQILKRTERGEDGWVDGTIPEAAKP